ncbi:MAG: phenylalanine--tRNA ligase subunit beta [Acidobacteriia bacterium]|nr:phenylalanine--tRNA ligase subunit beta [Terriglobia bacterium]
MKISPAWLREFVDIPADDRKLADDLTLAGISVESIESEGARTVYDVDFTPNRVDAMNHYGVARDCAAIYDRDLMPITALVARVSDPGTLVKDPSHAFPIEIQDPLGCARYTARVIRNVRIAPSPEKIAQRLELLGSRAINNIADASNYTLQEIGHPTHCFDLDVLEGGKIIVRRARPGEKLKTLDGVNRILHPDDLVIADAVKPVALAGVMGGFDSMITERTRHVLIESAWFDPASIRRTARRHSMHTDASHRFERGADLGITPAACARVAELILETAVGQLDPSETDAYARRIERPTLTLRRRAVRRHLGQDIPDTEIARILRRLGFGVTVGSITAAAPASTGAHAAVAEEMADFAVQVPTWRLDVEREIDLIEEIARIYGYDRFPNTLPTFVGGVIELPEARKEAKLRASLLGLGYHEAVSLTFISHADAQRFSSATPVEVANPISEEASVMRTSMVPSMLNMLGYNLNRGHADVRLFESGKIYETMGARTDEQRRLCMGATGAAIPPSIHAPGRQGSFFDLKGNIETLLGAFQYNSLYYDANTPDYYHPGRSARAVMDGATVARFGQLHPQVAAERKLRLSAQYIPEVYLAELDCERLYRHDPRQIRYQAIPRFPAVDRDFSFIFDETVTFESIRNVIAALRISELAALVPVEIFRGGAIPVGRYSMLLRATFQSAERTLRDDEVALWSQQIMKGLESLGGTLRTS